MHMGYPSTTLLQPPCWLELSPQVREWLWALPKELSPKQGCLTCWEPSLKDLGPPNLSLKQTSVDFPSHVTHTALQVQCLERALLTFYKLLTYYWLFINYFKKKKKGFNSPVLFVLNYLECFCPGFLALHYFTVKQTLLSYCASLSES